MKKYLLAFSMLFLVGVSVMDATPKHRHRHGAATVKVMEDSASSAIHVYSDTTSFSDIDEDDANSIQVLAEYDDDDDIDNPLDLLKYLSRLGGPSGTILGVFIIICSFLFLVAPFFVFVFILYYLIKRHNDRVKMSMKAMDMGQLPPTHNASSFSESDEVLWRKGVKNTAGGPGVALIFIMFRAKPLVGVGLLVLCYGLGQVYMARVSRKKRENNDIDNHPEF